MIPETTLNVTLRIKTTASSISTRRKFAKRKFCMLRSSNQKSTDPSSEGFAVPKRLIVHSPLSYY